jgi:HPt (histidine-containing phosphotransfer) domain-containing protein
MGGRGNFRMKDFAMHGEPPKLQPSETRRLGTVAEAATASASASPTGICRPQEAIERLGGLPDLYADVLGRLLDDKSGGHERLRAAVFGGDGSQIRAAAHSLKGLAMMCGTVSVAEMAAALESAGRAGEASQWRQLLARLDAEMVAARIILAPYR